MSRNPTTTSTPALAAFGLLLAALATAPPLGAADAPAPGQDGTRRRPWPHRPSTLLVKLRPGVGLEKASAIAKRHGATAARAFRVPPSLRGSPIERWHRLTLPPGRSAENAKAGLASDPAVEAAELDWMVSISLLPTDGTFGELWGLHNTGQTGGTPDADIDAPEAWDLTTGDPSVVVAVIDTGIDYAHLDLAANVWTNPGEVPGNGIDDDGNGYVDDVHGYDFVNRDGDPRDDNRHGTHVAGTIAAPANDVGMVGVAWNARVMPVKFLSAAGSGYTSDAIEAVLYATAMGARVLNNSWGGGGYSEALEDAIAAADAAGVLFVAAAGNYASDNDAYPMYPASYDVPNVVAVAATRHDDTRAGFSNFGAKSVHLGAPGESIYSTLPGASFGWLSGTSMAAPHVSGVAALLLSRFPSITVQQVKHRLLYGSDPLASLSGITVSGGRLNAFGALEDDAVPPDPVASLDVLAARARTVKLAWVATGDDGSFGRARRYDLRYSTLPIDEASFDAATIVKDVAAPAAPGAPEAFEIAKLRPDTLYYFALKVVDNVGNASALSPVASAATRAESTVFHDDMEAGPDRWTVGGSDGAGGPALWHLSTHRSGSPTTAFYYGREDTLTYDTGASNSGSITSPPVDLSGRSGSWLSFRHYLEVEGHPTYDQARVLVSADGGASWSPVYLNFTGTLGEMVEDGVDLSAYDGQVISLRFEFDTVDALVNGFEGWVVDDVAVSSEVVGEGAELRVDVRSVEGGLGLVLVGVPGQGQFPCYAAPDSIRTCTYPLPPGTVVTLEAVEDIDSDSVFVGWYGSCPDPALPSCQVTITGQIAVEAAFRGPQPLQVSVRSLESGLGAVLVSAPGPLDGCFGVPDAVESCSYLLPVGTVVSLQAITAPGTVFVAWVGPCADPSAPTCQVTVTDDVAVEAVFRGPQPLQVEIQSLEGGLGAVRVSAPGQSDDYCPHTWGTAETCSYLLPAGTTVTLEALTAPDTVFAGWLGPCADPTAAICQVTVTDDVLVAAQFRGPQPLQVEVQSVEDGTGTVRVSTPGRDEYCQGTPGTVQTCTYLFTPGTTVILEALAGPDSVFLSWAGPCSDPTFPCQVTTTDDVIVGAQFRGPQPLRVNVSSSENGAGGIQVDPPGQLCANAPGTSQSCTYLYAPGTAVTLTANPDPDSKFLGWAGACTGTEPCRVTLTDDLAVEAVFAIANHPPVADAAGPYSGVRHEPVSFDGSGSRDPDGDPLSYQWDFGDGTTGSGARPTHAYATLGAFTVTLVVSDGAATSPPVTTTATITNRAPVANAGLDQTAELGSAATLNGASSSDPDGDALTYEWRDGGGAVVGTAATVTLTLPLGTHDFTLTVRDAFGGTASDPVRVVVVDTTAPAITVTSPEGVTLLTGVPHTIEWTASDAGTIAFFDVWFSSDGAAFDPVAGCTALGGAVRSCTWSPTGPATAQARLRVVGRDASGNVGADDSAFAVVDPVVTVTAPNEPVSWGVGSTQTIAWTHNLGAGSTVRIEVSRDGGATWSVIAPSVPNTAATTGAFNWVVTGPPSGAARIRVTFVTNPAANDVSDGTFIIAPPFVIVASPSTRERWFIGTVQTIAWRHNLGTSGSVKLELSRDGGTTWSVIAASVPNNAASTGTFPWTVTGPPTWRARVRVTWTANPAVNDRSDQNFWIR